jgi:hypothetical protein
MKRKRQGQCSFCGQYGDVTREHVVPICLFPASTRGSAKFVLIPSCEKCNGLFSTHEDDFRNFCAVAGKDTPEARELFYGPVSKSMDRPGHGKGTLNRLYSKMVEVEEMPGRHRIYPDDSVHFILRKIVRGLTFKHFGKIVADDCVDVIVLVYKIPEEFDKDEVYTTIHPDVCQYFCDQVDEDHHSVWILKLLHTRIFVGVVSHTRSSNA